MKRGLKRTAVGLLMILVLLASSGAWLVSTESGLRAAWRALARLAPLELEAGTVGGRLAGPIVVGELRYRLDGIRGAIERVEIDWRPLELLRGTLSVARLHAVGVEVVRDPRAGAAADGPASLPEQLALPVDVEIDLLAIDALEWRSSAAAAPFTLDAVRFALDFDDAALEISGLEARAAMFAVTGRAQVVPRGRYPAELVLEAMLDLPGRPPAAAAVRGAGSLYELSLQVDVAQPYALDAELIVTDVIRGAVLDGTLRAQLTLADLGLEAPVTEALADLTLAGAVDDLRIAGRVTAALPDLADADINVDVRWRGDALLVESLELTERDGQAAVRLGGRVDVAVEPSVQLAGTWSGLRWPLAGDPVAVSPHGTLELTATTDLLEARFAADWDAEGRVDGIVRRVDERIAATLQWQDISWPPAAARLESASGTLRVIGTFDDYGVTLNADLAAAEGFGGGVRLDGAAGHLRAEGRGNSRSFDLALIDIAVLDGTLRGSGRLEWQPAMSAALDVAFAGLDSGLLLPSWPGRIGGGMTAAATFADGGIAADVARLDLSGTLRGRPIDVDARGRFQTPHRADIDQLTVRSGGSTVVASGSVDERVDIDWRIDSANLEDLWPSFAGRLTATGRATGPLARPYIEADANGESLAVEGSEIGALSLAARVDVAGQAESSLALTLGDARIAGRSIERLDVRGEGTAASHRASADASVDGVDVLLALSGALQRPWQPSFSWRFEVDAARVAHARVPAWTLDGAAAGTLTADGAELARSCLRSEDAALCVDAARRGARTDVRVELDALPFEHFAALLPDDTRVIGELSGEGRLELARQRAPRASLTLATTPARISAVRNGLPVPGLAFAAGRAALEFGDQRLDGEIELPLARGQGGLEGRAAVTLRDGLPLNAAEIDGRLRVRFDDLTFLSDLVRGAEATSGSLAIELELSGAAAAPRVAGDAVLRDGSARLRDSGILVESIEAIAVSDGSGALRVEASAMSGGGQLVAEGELRLAGSLPIGRIGLRGDTVELANTADARIWASPDLTLEMTTERIDLSGRLLIPRARLTPRDFSGGAVTVSSDQIIVDADELPSRGLSRPFYARVALTLGDDVAFEGFGLTAALGGAIELVEIPAEPVTGSGELRVRSGTYEAYGQTLDVRTGRLLFAGGAVARPGLDIEAVRRPTDDILVGARVRGTLDRPELTVFSEPSMPRQEQLSYLLLGRPLEAATGSETSALSQAALALGLRGGNFVSERLNEALGFDEFGIQSQAADANSASFVIGKYLTPSLYVSYGVGLFEPVNTLRLRYTISRRWRLVTESSTAASGGDLIYHIERGD